MRTHLPARDVYPQGVRLSTLGFPTGKQRASIGSSVGCLSAWKYNSERKPKPR